MSFFSRVAHTGDAVEKHGVSSPGIYTVPSCGPMVPCGVVHRGPLRSRGSFRAR